MIKQTTLEEASERARTLVSRMRIEEKIGQMCMYPGEPADIGFDDITLEQVSSDIGAYREQMSGLAELVVAGRIGSFVKVPGSRAANYLQECARRSRLGVPLLIGTDAIHGHTMYTSPATVFPTPISLASAFDPDLVRRVGEATAREMRATGYHWAFSPNVDVVRDQRWGRTGETFGEDQWLVSQLGVAMVQGLQCDGGLNGVAACAKHFVGSGEAFNGINGSEIFVSPRTLETHHFPPFKRCVDEGAMSIMAAHHAIDGVPCHAHDRYLTGLLKDAWGFQGIVASDWMDIGRLCTSQRVAGSFQEACELAVNAGIDLYMAGDGFFESVLDSVESGSISESRIDEAAERIITVKYLFGLFDEQPADSSGEKEVLRSVDHRALAAEAAVKSLVLLKNDRVLPLDAEGRRVLVTGPLADSQAILGDWVKTVQQRGVETIAQAIERLAPAGCAVERAETGSVRSTSDAEIEAACAVASECDVVVACVGENSSRWSAEPKTSGENCDRASLAIPGRQVELIERLAAVGKPVVVVLVTSRANAIPTIARRAQAILLAWEPGMYAGEAIASVLFGVVAPSGRLPVSMPRSSGHLRCVYDRPPLRLSHYGDSDETPLFRFGHGLGYASIRYDRITCPSEIEVGADLHLAVDLVHEGEYVADHIVLVFLKDLVSSVTTPERKLVASSRVGRIEPGERRTVELIVRAETMALVTADAERVIEPGDFELAVGDDTVQFKVCAGDRPESRRA